MTDPLSGVRLLDLTNVLAGPFCCYQLGLLGAEVVKVERPGTGDLAQVLGADPDRNAAGMGISFLAQNAGKKSVTLDLKSNKDPTRATSVIYAELGFAPPLACDLFGLSRSIGIPAHAWEQQEKEGPKQETDAADL